MQIPRRKSDELRRKDEGPVYLTAEGVEHLRKKLAYLKKMLPSYIEETQRTAAYGDRSDNAEYKEAKSTLRRTNFQILSLQDQINQAVIIVSGPNAAGQIRIGSVVTLVVNPHTRGIGVGVNGTQKIYRILGAREIDPANGRISYQSQLGKALLDHKKGDEVVISTPKGTQTYRIIEIK